MKCKRVFQGFSLIELVVAILVVAVLAAIAIPGYSSYVRKSRRTEAKSTLLDLASLEERYFSTQNIYSNLPTDLGYPNAAFPVTLSSGYYTITVSQPVAATAPAGATPGRPATYNATATAASDQLNDTQCQTFKISSDGTQQAFDANGVDNSATCWR